MNRGSKDKFILHDGPPFANGHIHIGHAFNKVTFLKRIFNPKITKDIICKLKRMSGAHASLIPGWDCHGLPIELKVAKENESNRTKIIQECRQYAERWIEVQVVSHLHLLIVLTAKGIHPIRHLSRLGSSLLNNEYFIRIQHFGIFSRI